MSLVPLSCVQRNAYYGPKTITHTFLLFENQFPNYAGHPIHTALWQEFFSVIRRLHKVLSVKAPITHINCLGLKCPIARSSVTQKKLFPNYLCSHVGPHSMLCAGARVL